MYKLEEICDKEIFNVNKKNLDLLNKYKLNLKTSFLNKNSYYVLNYDREFLHEDNYESIGKFRSLIIKDNNLLCYSPPKSLSYENFLNKKSDNLIMEELVEGTMINLFWDDTYDNEEDGSWEIATKTKVGGSNSFYFDEENKKTFRQMFLEACNKLNFFFEELPKEFCYSFILKHKQNRLVCPIMGTELFLINIYKINGYEIEIINREEVLKNSMVKSSKISIPSNLLKKEVNKEWSKFEKVINKYKNGIIPYYSQGIVIYDLDNHIRFKLYNPNFKEARDLNGNQPKLQYQYLVLRQNNKVSQFLKYYPQYKKPCQEYKDQIHQYTRRLHSNYVSCFIKKMQPLSEYPYQFKTHLYHLHKLYINTLMKDKKCVDFHFVIQYFNNLHPSQQIYILNHNLKRQNDDYKTNNIINSLKEDI